MDQILKFKETRGSALGPAQVKLNRRKGRKGQLETKKRNNMQKRGHMHTGTVWGVMGKAEAVGCRREK